MSEERCQNCAAVLDPEETLMECENCSTNLCSSCDIIDGLCDVCYVKELDDADSN